MPRTIAAILSLLALTWPLGCVTIIEPAPGAERVPGVGRAAAAAQSGVSVVAAAQAWRGFPSDLDSVVTPMLVTLSNDSDRRLEVRYEHFSLLTPGGVRYAAIPPFQVAGVAIEPLRALDADLGFGVAPYLSPWYPGWPVYRGHFPYHPAYYDNYYLYSAGFRSVALPTGDMIVKALPEGVLDPGGRITGYLYFEEIIDVSRFTFVARLIEPGVQEFGTLEIPFIVR